MNAFNKDVKVLDVTLRDGSYVIDFQFTQHDTAVICSLLESAGIDWIEIGHGVGLNGSNKGYGAAACTDEDYIQAAAANIRHAKWGTFFIPGIGTREDIKMAAGYQMPFIRIGTNITDFEKAIPYIELAKSLGMFVAYNGMKSYAATPEEFAAIAKRAQQCGTDMICLVDSAGGLFPEHVEHYFRRTQDATDIRIGFHGHDNLSLAMANTLKAIECGAYMVDTSLQGMGRSAGNAKTEVLLAILKQKGMFPETDLNRLIDIGQNIINPLIKNKGADPLAIISGYAMFHSSFTPKVSRYAKDYNIDIRDLIIRLCEEDKVDAPDDLLARLSKEQQQRQKPVNKAVSIQLLHKERNHHSIEGVKNICRELQSHGIKYNKYSVLNIAFDPMMQNDLAVSYNIQSDQSYVCGAVSIKNERAFREALPAIKDIDILLVDKDENGFVEDAVEAAKKISGATVLSYSDSEVWVSAVEEQVVRLLDETTANKKIAVAGNSTKAEEFSRRLKLQHADVFSVTDETSKDAMPEADVIVLWENADAVLLPVIAEINKKMVLLDASLHSFSEALLQTSSKNRHVQAMRLNMWPSLMATLSTIHQLYKINKDAFGKKTIEGIDVVSGGYIGAYGDIVVDDISAPRRIIGMADGKGKVIYEYPQEIREKIHALENAISNILLSEQSS
jgi:4-hydroxy-2-oxovalerate aldolase